MNFSIAIPMKAFSLNAAFYASRKIKTRECREWERGIESYLLRSLAIKKLAAYKEFHVSMGFVYPQQVFYNAKGDISAKTFDLSNSEKLLLDCIFRVIGSPANDKMVTQLISSKQPGDQYLIKIEIFAVEGHSRAVG